MNDRYTRVTAPAGFDGQGTRRDYYFKTRNGAREFRLRIKCWKAEQKSPADTLSFDDSDKRWLAYLRAHVGNLELLPAIVIAGGAILRGWARSASGQIDEGISWIENGIRDWRAAGLIIGLPFFLALKAEALHFANHTS